MKKYLRFLAPLFIAVLLVSACAPQTAEPTESMATEEMPAETMAETEAAETTEEAYPAEKEPTEDPAEAYPAEAYPAETEPAEAYPAETETFPYTDEEMEALILEKVEDNHTLEFILSQDKTADEWSTTLDRMIGYGADISPDEKALIIEWLISR